jgi:alpha/beta superfamily hydrolase
VPEIVANSVLPARRESLTLTTADGLRLVGELASPLDRRPVATLVCLHPLPTHGGLMDSHLYRKAAWRLPALAGIAVLRFNTRGTSSAAGTSEGEFDNAVGEGLDLRAAVDESVRRGLPDPWLVGWSFGTDVVLRHGDHDPVRGAVLLSPPLRFSTDVELDHWAASGRPLTALVPELDDYLRPDEARERFARVPQAEVVGVEGAKHLWVGEKYVRIVLDALVAQLVPGSAPLPDDYDGPMERWSDL